MDPLRQLRRAHSTANERNNRLRIVTITACLLLALHDARQCRAARRQLHQLYLCRPQLLPNPRIGTPWQRLYETRNDRAFITTMGVDVRTFDYILTSGFEVLWNTIPIPRNDVSIAGNPRLGARSLDAAGALGLYLHWISSPMRETSLQEMFALIPSSVNRYISFAEDLLHTTLKQIPEARIGWPQDLAEFEHFSQLIQARHHLLLGAFGTMDGLNLPVEVAFADPELENATYNGWLHSHRISCVMAFVPDGTIMTAQLNVPGSWHDVRVARPIYEKLRDHTPAGYCLVCDTAFPRGSAEVAGHIKAPLKDGQAAPTDADL